MNSFRLKGSSQETRVEIDTDRTGRTNDQCAPHSAARCAAAHEVGRWIILSDAEVVVAETDFGGFSSRVTDSRAIPNTLDGTDHAVYRAVGDR